MGNCWSLQSGGLPNSNTASPDPNNQSGSIQFSAGHTNLGLIQNGNSVFLGSSSHSGGTSRLFSSNYSTDNNTSTSIWGSENSQASRVREKEEYPHEQNLDAANLGVFTLAELKAATKNFRADTVIGEGGFGTVYKGVVKDRAASKGGEGLTIAIKRLNPESFQGVAEWKQEVDFLGRLFHPNLIKLLGFGAYNIIESYPLSWDTRLTVMIGVAKGLNFLHSLEKKIIYRDLKPSNILLDKAHTPKLSDFGLAKCGPSADQSHVTTRVMGTYGHAAPEYIATGHLYVKSDVYGFGIVLVEMLTGKRIVDILRLSKEKSLQDWLKSNLLNRVKMRSTMDAKLEGKYPPNLASQVAQLALKCIQTNPKVRPSMKEVLETLEQIEAANEKPADNKKRATHSQVVQPDGG